MKHSFKIASLLLALIASGCNTKTTVIIPTDDSGTATSGTMTYTLDGTVYKVPAKHKGDLNRDVGSYAIFLNSGQQLSIDGILEANQQEVFLVTIGLTSSSEINVGSTSSGTTKTVYPAALTYQDVPPGSFGGRQYHSTATFTGKANITKLDLTSKLTSGTFNGKLTQYFPSGATGEVNLTNGSFTDLPIEVK